MSATRAYTAAQAIRDYLADGLPGRAPKTIRTQREVLEPLLPILGNVPLRELTAADVRSALIMLAATRATRTVSMTHAALARAIRHAEAGDKVRRNVAALIDSPSGGQGRPSRSLTFEQAVALITAAQEYALYAYVVLSVRPVAAGRPGPAGACREPTAQSVQRRQSDLPGHTACRKVSAEPRPAHESTAAGLGLCGTNGP